MQYGFGRGKKHRTQPKFSAQSPQGLAICDGCGFMVQHSELRQKQDYRGGANPRPDSQDAQTNAQEVTANALSVSLNILYGLA